MSISVEGIINTGDVTAEPFIPPVPLEKTKGPALLPVASIDAKNHVRTVNPDAAARMADSMDRRGLITPIVVRPAGDGTYRLVVGGHRHAGAAILGWTDIPCDVRDLDDDEALDLELQENLDLHALDPLDFGLFCDARQQLDERLAARGKRGGDRRSGEAQSNRQNVEMVPRFTQEMAERLGRSERTIQRAIATVRALDGETIALIRGTSVAAKEINLVKLGREPNVNKRRNLAEKMISGVAKTFEAARIALGDAPPPAVDDAQGVALAQLHAAWGKADPATRLTFLADIDAAYLTAPSPPIDKEAAAKAMGVSLAPSRGGRKPGKGVH